MTEREFSGARAAGYALLTFISMLAITGGGLWLLDQVILQVTADTSIEISPMLPGFAPFLVFDSLVIGLMYGLVSELRGAWLFPKVFKAVIYEDYDLEEDLKGGRDDE